jgi:hypothetical protein
MAKRKQLTVSMAALRAYQPKGQDMRYPFGADSLAKLDEYISLKITAPGYNHAESIDLIGLDVYVYKYFEEYGWFFGIISRYFNVDNVGLIQVNKYNKIII